MGERSGAGNLHPAPRLVTALGVGSCGMLGLLPGPAGAFDVQAYATWLALLALPLGVLAGAARSQLVLLAPAVLWLALLALANARAGGAGLPRADLGWTALVGLYCLGGAIGVAAPGARWPCAGLAFLAAGLLCALPLGAALLAEPWPPALAARLLDLSPVGLVLECAGSDWMRDPLVYVSAGTADIGPDLRGAWRGNRTAPPLFLGGYALFVLVRGLRARGA